MIVFLLDTLSNAINGIEPRCLALKRVSVPWHTKRHRAYIHHCVFNCICTLCGMSMHMDDHLILWFFIHWNQWNGTVMLALKRVNAPWRTKRYHAYSTSLCVCNWNGPLHGMSKCTNNCFSWCFIHWNQCNGTLVVALKRVSCAMTHKTASRLRSSLCLQLHGTSMRTNNCFCLMLYLLKPMEWQLDACVEMRQRATAHINAIAPMCIIMSLIAFALCQWAQIIVFAWCFIYCNQLNGTSTLGAETRQSAIGAHKCLCVFISNCTLHGETVG